MTIRASQPVSSRTSRRAARPQHGSLPRASAYRRCAPEAPPGPGRVSLRRRLSGTVPIRSRSPVPGTRSSRLGLVRSGACPNAERIPHGATPATAAPHRDRPPPRASSSAEEERVAAARPAWPPATQGDLQAEVVLGARKVAMVLDVVVLDRRSQHHGTAGGAAGSLATGQVEQCEQIERVRHLPSFATGNHPFDLLRWRTCSGLSSNRMCRVDRAGGHGTWKMRPSGGAAIG